MSFVFVFFVSFPPVSFGLIIITDRKRSLGQGNTLDLSVILFTGGVPGQVHPPWAGTLPPHKCMVGYGQQADGTHPTGMHSCFLCRFYYGYPRCEWVELYSSVNSVHGGGPRLEFTFSYSFRILLLTCCLEEYLTGLSNSEYAEHYTSYVMIPKYMK